MLNLHETIIGLHQKSRVVHFSDMEIPGIHTSCKLSMPVCLIAKTSMKNFGSFFPRLIIEGFTNIPC